MNTMKTLMLAGFAALSLGVGTAMAQDGGGATSDYWAQQYRARSAITANRTASLSEAGSAQFGASDHAISHFDTDMTGGGF